MRGLQVCLFLAICAVVKAGYVGYSNYRGYSGYSGYPSYSTYGGYDGYGGYGGYNGYNGDGHEIKYAYPKYAFDYSVKDPHTGDFKTQWETRDGDVVKGAYSLADPDGTTRIVEYVADKHNGFNAVVKRIGQAYHPQVYIKNYNKAGYYGYH